MPRSACTPNHVPKSPASAKVNKTKLRDSITATPVLSSSVRPSLLPVVAASVARRSAAAAAAAVAERELGVDMRPVVPDTDIVASAAFVAAA